MPGTVVYVAHPPKATLEDVVQTSRKTQAAGLAACPHIVARRIESRTAHRMRARDWATAPRSGGALRSMNAMRNVAGLATSPDQMLTSIVRYSGSGATHIAGVHFYSFGGALATARWLRAVADGRFEMNPAADAFATTG